MSLFAKKRPTPHHSVLGDLLLVRSLLGLALAGVGVFAAAGGEKAEPWAWWVIGLGSIVALSGIPLAILVRWGWATLATRLLAIIDLCTILALVYLSGGTASAALVLLLWPTAAATLLLGPRDGFLAATASALLLGGLYLLEQQWGPAPDFLAPTGISLTEGWARTATWMLAVVLASALCILMNGAVASARAGQAEALAAAEVRIGRAQADITRLSAMEEMTRVIQRIQDQDVLLPRALARMATILDAAAGLLALSGHDARGSREARVAARLNIEEQLGRELLQEASASRADLLTNPIVGGLPEESSPRNPFVKAGFTDYLVGPLRAGDEFLGMVLLLAHRRFGAADVTLLAALNAQLAIAIKNVRFTEDLRRVNQELLRLDQMKSDFLATMSHELRTPLTSVIGYTDLLLSGMLGAPSEEQKNLLRRILNNSEALLYLINDILDLTKIEAGRLELSIEPVDLRHTLDHVLGLVKARASEKQITLTTLLPGDLPLLLADPSKLEQILLNLLANAIKFTRELGSVAVEARPTTAGMMEIRVSDNGIGISSEDSERIFQRFTQLDSTSTRSEGGTGLGLSITKDLIELHGGSIRLQSQPGKGSTFMFTIPRTP